MRVVQSPNSAVARSGPELTQAAHHGAPGLSGLHAAQPRLRGRIEVAEQRRNGARVRVAELVAGFAAIGLDQMDPLALASARSAKCRCPSGRCREIRSSREP